MFIVSTDYSMAVNVESLTMIGRRKNKVIGYDNNMKPIILAEFETDIEAKDWFRDLICNIEGGNKTFCSDSLGGIS